MGCDVVFAALDVKPNRLNLPGIDRENVTFALDVYGRQEQLGKSVVVSGGSVPLQAEALRYAACAPEFELLGDCNVVSNMQAALRSGFAAASLI